MHTTSVPTSFTRNEALTRQAEILVGQTFYGTLLKQMHNSPFRSELFSGGRGGQMFASLLDQHLTQRMSRGIAAPLVRRIVARLQPLKEQVRQDVTPT